MSNHGARNEERKKKSLAIKHAADDDVKTRVKLIFLVTLSENAEQQHQIAFPNFITTDSEYSGKVLEEEIFKPQKCMFE